MIAHRGASGQRPENTLAAYELAVAQGADMIEIDLHLTHDGGVVVTHDADLTGLGGEGEIADATLATVRGLDAGAGERVPLLDEVLDAFGDRIPFNIALLVSRRFPQRAVERARALGAEALNPEAPITSAALVEEAHAAGLAVYVFTVDQLSEMERLLDLGVDGLFTNHPDRMRALVGRRAD